MFTALPMLHFLFMSLVVYLYYYACSLIVVLVCDNAFVNKFVFRFYFPIVY